MAGLITAERSKYMKRDVIVNVSIVRKFEKADYPSEKYEIRLRLLSGDSFAILCYPPSNGRTDHLLHLRAEDTIEYKTDANGKLLVQHEDFPCDVPIRNVT